MPFGTWDVGSGSGSAEQQQQSEFFISSLFPQTIFMTPWINMNVFYLHSIF